MTCTAGPATGTASLVEAPHAPGRTAGPSIHPARVTVALLAGPLLAGCLSTGTLREGQPLEPPPGHGIVYGRIAVSDGETVVPPMNPGADWSGAGLRARPELRVYLQQLNPRAVTLPPVWGPGLFAWSLAPGDYLLMALAEADVASRPEAMRFRPVAALRVSAGGPWCSGALGIRAGGPVVLDRGPLRIDPSVISARVTDDCDSLMPDLAARYAPLDRPATPRLMVAADDLAFEDPALVAKVSAHLDAAVPPDSQ